jgi:hypothetical protein
MTRTAQLLDTVQVFTGDVNPAETRIYVRLPAAAVPENCRLAGSVIGPTCAYSHTLSAAVPLVDRGREPALLAEAIVPDACFWSPELPFLYQLRIELRQGGDLLEAIQRPIGIKPLGVWKNRLLYAKKTIVLRAARFEPALPEIVSACHEAEVTLLAVDPSDELLQRASQLGAWIIAYLRDARELARLSRWPAAAIAVLPHNSQLDGALEFQARNLLLAQSMRLGDPVASWAELGICPREDAVALAGQLSMPLIAAGSLDRDVAIGAVRTECDHLQRDLAGQGEFAGYLVGDV